MSPPSNPSPHEKTPPKNSIDEKKSFPSHWLINMLCFLVTGNRSVLYDQSQVEILVSVDMLWTGLGPNPNNCSYDKFKYLKFKDSSSTFLRYFEYFRPASSLDVLIYGNLWRFCLYVFQPLVHYLCIMVQITSKMVVLWDGCVARWLCCELVLVMSSTKNAILSSYTYTQGWCQVSQMSTVTAGAPGLHIKTWSDLWETMGRQFVQCACLIWPPTPNLGER